MSVKEQMQPGDKVIRRSGCRGNVCDVSCCNKQRLQGVFISCTYVCDVTMRMIPGTSCFSREHLAKASAAA